MKEKLYLSEKVTPEEGRLNQTNCRWIPTILSRHRKYSYAHVHLSKTSSSVLNWQLRILFLAKSFLKFYGEAKLTLSILQRRKAEKQRSTITHRFGNSSHHGSELSESDTTPFPFTLSRPSFIVSAYELLLLSLLSELRTSTRKTLDLFRW